MGHEMFFLYQGFVEANFEPAEVSEAPGEAAAGNWGEAKGEDKVHKGLFNESPVAARGADGSGPGTPQHAAYGGGKDSSPLRENASEAQSHMAMDNTQVRSSHLLLGVFTKGSHFGEVSARAPHAQASPPRPPPSVLTRTPPPGARQISLLRNEPRLMGFRSVAQCELFTLSKEDLDEFTLFNPEGHQELLRSAFRRTKAILRARRLALQTQNPPKEDNISFAQVGALAPGCGHRGCCPATHRADVCGPQCDRSGTRTSPCPLATSSWTRTATTRRRGPRRTSPPTRQGRRSARWAHRPRTSLAQGLAATGRQVGRLSRAWAGHPFQTAGAASSTPLTLLTRTARTRTRKARTTRMRARMGRRTLATSRGDAKRAREMTKAGRSRRRRRKLGRQQLRQRVRIRVRGQTPPRPQSPHHRAQARGRSLHVILT